MIDVRQLVENHLVSERKDKERTHKVFYASELGYCPLKIFFSITQPRRAELRALKVFRVGDLVHEYIQRLLEEQGAQSEVPIRQIVDLTRGIEVHGRIDVLHEGEPYELKSAGRLPDEPYAHHVAQLNAYLHMLGVERGYLVYFEKNTFDIAQFTVKRNPHLWEMTLDKIRAVHDAVEAKQQGDEWLDKLLAYNVGGWECKYCVYRDICPLAMMR